MHSLGFYISTCKCVMQAEPDNPESWTDLYRLIPCLRQSLGCYVCFNILQDPMGPSHNVCKHTVCRKCVGGKMKLKPTCSWCKDHYLFEPNALQKILVMCFKKLCMYILSSPLASELEKCSKNGQSNNLVNILKDAANFVENEEDVVATNTIDEDLDVTSLPSKEECIQFFDKPGCSSDDDHGRFVSGSEEEDSTHESVDEAPPVNKLRRVQRSTHSSNEINGNSEPNVALKTRDKRVPKTVVFFKRASENKKSRITQNIKKKAMKQSSGKKRSLFAKSRSKSRLTKKQEEAPNDLERVDTSELSLKRVKKELPPPDLKPLTSCKCGKSGNSNQLTCLGQRCQCYSMKLPCIGCKCRGCRNPKKGPDSSAYPTSGIYGSSYLRSGSRTAPETVCVNM